MQVDKKTMQVELSDGTYLLLDKMPLLKTREVLTFATDIHEHFDGTETRYQIWQKPRQQIYYHNYEDSTESRLFLMRLRQNLRQKFLIVSHERYYYRNYRLNDVTFWYTNDRYFSPLMMYKEFEHLKRIYVIDGRNAYNHVALQKNEEHPENHYTKVGVYGLYQAVLVNQAQIMLNARHCQYELQFDILNPYDNYRGYGNSYLDDVAPVDERLLNNDYVEYQYTQHQIINDDGLNKFYHTRHQHHQEIKNLRLILRNQEDYIKIKNWLYYLCGRYKAFLLADFENLLQDVRFSQGYLIARKTHFNSKELILITVYYDGRREIRRKSVEEFYYYDDFIYIKTDLVYNLDNGTVDKYLVYPANWYRLETDNIEFHFLGNHIAELNLPIKQLYAER